MDLFAGSEINAPKPGALLLCGRDYGAEEARRGRPFVGTAGGVLDDCLRERGIRRRDINITNVVNEKPRGNEFGAHSRARVEEGIARLHKLVARLRPSLIVAFGNEASYALVDKEEDWPTPSGDIFGAKGIQERRGYVYEGVCGVPVLVTVHPAAAARQWLPWRTLLSFDLGKAKEIAADGHLRRPQREVEVVGSRSAARRAARSLRRHGVLASDIENYDERQLACIGFAPGPGRAVVFPAPFLDECRPLLEDPQITTVWQNAQYDLYYLLTRCDIRVRGRIEDTMLQWHSMYPELAGKKISGTGSKRTHKSLAFLASIYTTDAWYKDYDFETEEDRYILNGRDCAITFDVFEQQKEKVERLGVQDIYRHEVGLIWPVVEMQARGMRVDDDLRRERIEALEARIDADTERLNELVIPLIEERSDRSEDRMRLFENIEGVCPCCRHASKKQFACWSCAGFESAPSKADLVGAGGDPSKLKRELEEEMLSTCKVCEGKPRREWLEFNPNSSDQRCLVLFDILRLPKRYNHGSLTADESALKSLLAYC